MPDYLGEHRPSCFCWKCTGKRMQCFATMSADPKVVTIPMPAHVQKQLGRCVVVDIPYHSNDRTEEIRRELRAQDPGPGESFSLVFPFRSGRAIIETDAPSNADNGG